MKSDGRRKEGERIEERGVEVKVEVEVEERRGEGKRLKSCITPGRGHCEGRACW